MTFFNTAFHNVVRTIMTVFNTAKNPAKNLVTSAAMEDELKQVFPSITLVRGGQQGQAAKSIWKPAFSNNVFPHKPWP